MSNPQYIDLQVNGYAGVDFNGEYAPDDLHRAVTRLREDGVHKILATIITDDPDRMCQRIAALVSMRRNDPLAGDVIAGIHVEGPFISPTDGYRGAHPKDAICPASTDLAGKLIDAGDGLVRLVTLAPECDAGFATTRYLSQNNIHVSAGHTDASVDQLRGAIDAGLQLFTHLGNGCPRQMDRHDNIVQRALSLADSLTLCFIADGVHVPLFALGNYIHLAGVDRCLVVTDAIAAAGQGPGRYRLGRWEVEVGADLSVWAPDRSHLVGSAVTMKRSVENLQKLGLDEKSIVSLTRHSPGKWLL